MDITAVGASSQSASSQASTQLSADFDTFLTLLTTQLQNQDPLEPLDTEQFTQQLVQFAGVEQSIQTNEHLEALIALQSASANESALAMVGRIASVDADVSTLGDDSARWAYELPQNASEASVRIFNEANELVTAFNASSAAGVHDVNWGGAANDGDAAAPGQYRMEVAAFDRDGQPIEASIVSRGRVDAVSFVNGAPEIEIAGQLFPLQLVQRIDETF